MHTTLNKFNYTSRSEASEWNSGCCQAKLSTWCQLNTALMCVWGINQFHRRATVAEKLNPGYNRKLSKTQCIAACCIWSFILTDRSGCQCWRLATTKTSTMGTWAADLAHGERTWLTMFSYTLWGRLGALCATGKRGLQDALWAGGNQAETVWSSRQCYAAK